MIKKTNKQKMAASLVISASLLTPYAVFAQDSGTAFSSKIEQHINTQKIFHDLIYMASEDNARVTGFEGEHKSADYIIKEFKKYGIESETQKFDVIAFLDEGSTLKVDNLDIASKTLTYSNSTNGTLTESIVYVGKGSPQDFEGKNLEGKIALIQRGDFSFYDKAVNAAKAGAKAAIIFNNADGTFSGTLGQSPGIPVIGISKTDGEDLVTKLENDNALNVTMEVKTKLEDSYSQNVIGTLKTQKNIENPKTIIVGAHFDSVDTPGANDNASGTTVMLEVARLLSHPQIKKNLNYNIKFVAFGAEEIGLVGSEKYVEQLKETGEINDIAAMINMDMVGVGDKMGILNLNNNVDKTISDMAKAYIEEFGYKYSTDTSGSSDHAPFERAEIPSVFLNYGNDPNYHTDEDSIDKIISENLHNMTNLVANLIANMPENLGK